MHIYKYKSYEKIFFLGGGGESPKKGRLGQIADLRGGLAKKKKRRGYVFEVKGGG